MESPMAKQRRCCACSRPIWAKRLSARASTHISRQHQYANATADDFWDAQAKTSKKPVDQIMPTFVKQAGVPIINLKSQCSGNSTTVTLDQRRYYFDREKFQAPNDQLWQVPLCLKSSTGAQKCELLTKKEETFTLPGCSTWVLANAGADRLLPRWLPARCGASARERCREQAFSGRADRFADGYLGVGPRRPRAGGRLSRLRAGPGKRPQSRGFG